MEQHQSLVVNTKQVLVIVANGPRGRARRGVWYDVDSVIAAQAIELTDIGGTVFGQRDREGTSLVLTPLAGFLPRLIGPQLVRDIGDRCPGDPRRHGGPMQAPLR